MDKWADEGNSIVGTTYGGLVFYMFNSFTNHATPSCGQATVALTLEES